VKIIQLEEVKLNGVGPASLKKLVEGGVTTINAIAMMTEYDLVELTGLGPETALSAIDQARIHIGAGFISGVELATRLGDEETHTTGSTILDEALGGGIHIGVISEFSGEFGALKTQLCMTASVICAATKGTVIVLDTEGTWGGDGIVRLKQIAESRGYDPDVVLSKFLVARAFNSEHMGLLIKQLPSLVNEHKAKMVVVDSIISHFRSEDQWQGRGKLANRQQTLGGVVGRLLKVAEGFGVSMLFTNQVQANVEGGWGPKFKPAGGHVLGHACTYRFMLFKGKQVSGGKFDGGGEGKDYQTSILHILDTSSLPPSKTRVMCTEAGIVNADGTYPEQVKEEILDETIDS